MSASRKGRRNLRAVSGRGPPSCKHSSVLIDRERPKHRFWQLSQNAVCKDGRRRGHASPVSALSCCTRRHVIAMQWVLRVGNSIRCVQLNFRCF